MSVSRVVQVALNQESLLASPSKGYIVLFDCLGDKLFIGGLIFFDIENTDRLNRQDSTI